MKIKPKAKKRLQNGVLEIEIFDTIGLGVTSYQVKNTIAINPDAKLIKILINSPGGYVSDGMEIYNAIKISKIPVHCHIVGIAASMASIIALAGAKVLMDRNAKIMTHLPRIDIKGGSSDDLLLLSNDLKKTEDTLAFIYSRKTGLTLEEAKQRYLQSDFDNWMSADEALKEGLIDEIIDNPKISNVHISAKASVKEAWNIYNKALTKTFNNNQKSIKMEESLIELLGLPQDATPEDILQAVQKLLEDKEAAKESAKEMVTRAFTAKTIDEEKRNLYNKILETEPNFVIKNFATSVANARPVVPNVVSMINDSRKHGYTGSADTKAKSDWTLDDYRKFAPNELRENKALYDKLLAKEGLA